MLRPLLTMAWRRGDTLMIPAVNWLDLNAVYIDVDVSGEGVDFYAVKA